MEGLIEIKNININTMPRKTSWGIIMFGLCLMFLMFSFGSRLIEMPTSNIVGVISMGFALLCIPLHELAHGIAFKIYTGKVKFGIKWRTKMGVCAYATSPNSVLTKKQMIITGLAPQIMTVIIMAILYFVNGVNSWLPYSLLVFATMNFGGGSADMYCAWLLLREKGQIFVKDTVTGMQIYRRGEL